MKTRQGFVSNSSSSSFIIYGTYIGGYIAPVAEKVLGLMTDEEITSIFGEGVTRDEVDLGELEDVLRESQYEPAGIAALDDAGISMYYFDDWYIGFDICVNRHNLIHGHGFSEKELNDIDALLKELTGHSGAVHEGEYYN